MTEDGQLMDRNPFPLGYALTILLLTLMTTAVVHLRITHSFWSPELAASIGLLCFNALISLTMLSRKSPALPGGVLTFSLILIGAKLFENTFTILLLIGLQAVRTPVFVPVFFAGYFVLLGVSVWALHRTSEHA